MKRNTIQEMKEILEAIEHGKAIQFTYDGVNWNDTDKFINPYAPDFMHNKFRIKPEKNWRPFKDVNEFIKAAIQHQSSGDIDEIHFKSNESDQMQLVTAIVFFEDKYPIRLGSSWISMREFFESYTFSDGTPCGVEEDA